MGFAALYPSYDLSQRKLPLTPTLQELSFRSSLPRKWG